MSMKPRVSILMANYNNADYIACAIESVLRQSFLDWELVIIDDVSTDNSIEVIRKYLINNKVRFIKNPKNMGYISTLKRLVKIAKAPILGVLDSDDALDRIALESVMRIYDKENDFGLVYSQNYRCDSNLKPLELGHSKLIPVNKTNLQLNYVHHFRSFKKSIYFQTEGYSEEMKYAEDIDLTFKLEEVTRFYYMNMPLYFYRVLKKSQTHGFKNEMINRSSTALAKLNAYKRRLNTNIPNLNKAEIAEVLFFGVFTAILARRFKLMLKLKLALWQINPLFLFQPKFYGLLIKKIIKIIKIKLNISTLRKVDSHLT